jgi:hypothetical protein
MIGALSRMIHNRSDPEASLVNAYCRMGMARIDTEGLKIPRGFNPDLEDPDVQLHQFLRHITTKTPSRPACPLDHAEVRRCVAMPGPRGSDDDFHEEWSHRTYAVRAKLRGFTFAAAEGEKSKRTKSVANSYFAVDTKELYDQYLPEHARSEHAGRLSYGQIQRWLVVDWVRVRRDDPSDAPERQSFAFAQVRLFRPAQRDKALPAMDVVDLRHRGIVFNYLPVTVLQQPVALAWDPNGFDRRKPPTQETSTGRFYVLPLFS